MSKIFKIVNSTEDGIEFAVTNSEVKGNTLLVNSSLPVREGVRILVLGENSPQMNFFRIVHACERLDAEDKAFNVYFAENALEKVRYENNIAYYKLTKHCSYTDSEMSLDKAVDICDYVLISSTYDDEFLTLYRSDNINISKDKTLVVSPKADPWIIANNTDAIYDRFCDVIASTNE